MEKKELDHEKRHSGYKNLISFQTAQIVYDLTVTFCNRFIDKRSRTHDQMVQAARSGVQNIAEGSGASATSKLVELRLTGIARASLLELLTDYEDYLRQRALSKWDPESEQVFNARKECVNQCKDGSIRNLSSSDAERYANTMICLIHQACFLLGRQIESLEKRFMTQGGYAENLFRDRSQRRNRN